MKTAALISSLILLQGCGAIDTMTTEEKIWQSMNIVDGLQTINIAKNPRCYYEATYLSKALVGKHPSEAEVIALMTTYAVAHYQMSRFLERRDAPQWVQKTFQYVMIGTKGVTIANNHRIGLSVVPESIPGCQ